MSANTQQKGDGKLVNGRK